MCTPITRIDYTSMTLNDVTRIFSTTLGNLKVFFRSVNSVLFYFRLFIVIFIFFSHPKKAFVKETRVHKDTHSSLHRDDAFKNTNHSVFFFVNLSAAICKRFKKGKCKHIHGVKYTPIVRENGIRVGIRKRSVGIILSFDDFFHSYDVNYKSETRNV